MDQVTYAPLILNMTHGVNRNSDDVFFSSNDTYIRKNNSVGFRTSLDVYSKSDGCAGHRL